MRQGRAEALVGGLIALAGSVALAIAVRDHRRRRRMRRALNDDYDYSNRSGFPRPAEEMRGIARSDPPTEFSN